MLSQRRQTPAQPAQQCLPWQWCPQPAHLPAEHHRLLGLYLTWDVSLKTCCPGNLHKVYFRALPSGCEGYHKPGSKCHSFAMAMLPTPCTFGRLCAAQRGLEWKGRNNVCQPITRTAGHALQRADGAPCQLSSVCKHGHLSTCFRGSSSWISGEHVSPTGSASGCPGSAQG